MLSENLVKIETSKISTNSKEYIKYLFSTYSPILNILLCNFNNSENLKAIHKVLIVNYAQVHDKQDSRYKWIDTKLTNIIFQIIFGLNAENVDKSTIHDAWALSRLIDIVFKDGKYLIEPRQEESGNIEFSIDNPMINDTLSLDGIKINSSNLNLMVFYNDLTTADQNNYKYSFDVFSSLNKSIKNYFNQYLLNKLDKE